MRLLLPIDGSDCAQRAVEHVVTSRNRYAGDGGLEIHLVNVQPHVSDNVARFVGTKQVTEFHHDESDKAFARAQAALDAAGLAHTTHARVGHTAEEVTRLAAAIGCDQIVMGTHGRGALADLLAGSTTLRIVHLATVPVLLVK